ncbi:MAG: hypothetical protein M1825_003392 [Sarcosagium campestre]|nr:MAG: hypothetical protein M1825_003392 [Sarcosagium campestre]
MEAYLPQVARVSAMNLQTAMNLIAGPPLLNPVAIAIFSPHPEAVVENVLRPSSGRERMAVLEAEDQMSLLVESRSHMEDLRSAEMLTASPGGCLDRIEESYLESDFAEVALEGIARYEPASWMAAEIATGASARLVGQNRPCLSKQPKNCL